MVACSEGVNSRVCSERTGVGVGFFISSGISSFRGEMREKRDVITPKKSATAYRINGFTPSIDIIVIESIAHQRQRYGTSGSRGISAGGGSGAKGTAGMPPGSPTQSVETRGISVFILAIG